MAQYPPQTQESMAKGVAYFDTYKHNGIPLMFIDSVIPNHYRMNYALVGDTASENPDFENQRAISTPHNFQIGMAWAPPGNGPHWHTHDYVEMFVPLKGSWQFFWSNDPNPATPEGDGSFLLNEWDVISLPAGVYRRFENAGTEIAWFFAVLESHKVYEGKDPYWSPVVEDAAAGHGFKASEQGKMIKPDNYTSVESQVRDSLLQSFESLEGKSIHDFSPIPAK
jgi:quercetin dioxygenase-like cupin family protein